MEQQKKKNTLFTSNASNLWSVSLRIMQSRNLDSTGSQAIIGMIHWVIRTHSIVVYRVNNPVYHVEMRDEPALADAGTLSIFPNSETVHQEILGIHHLRFRPVSINRM